MAKTKGGNIDAYKDRFSSPVGVKNLVLPKKNNGAKRKTGKKK